MRADNHGEGGIMALMALRRSGRWRPAASAHAGPGRRASSARRCSTATASSRRRSRCSARSRAWRSRAPALAALVVPLSLAVLIGLFVVQRLGTAAVGALFGPVMVVWFVVHRRCSALLRDRRRTRRSSAALNPSYARRVPGRRRRWPASSRWARWCWRSPAPRRSTPTWATSAAGRSAAPGSCWCLPALVAQLLRPGRAAAARTPPRVENPFYCLVPAWCAAADGACWRRWPR